MALSDPKTCAVKRVGTPGYGMSSHTWIRGFLQDVYGVKPDDMQWIETAKSSDGGKLNSSFAKYFLPNGFPLKKGPIGVDESEMLIAGDVDALITAIEPKAYTDGHPKIRRLFPMSRRWRWNTTGRQACFQLCTRSRSAKTSQMQTKSAKSTLFRVQPSQASCL